MRITRRGATYLIGLLAILGLLATACGNDDSTGGHDLMPMDDSAGTTIEVEVAGSKPVDGVQRYRIDAGDDVTIVVNGDTTDELHIHGYDLIVPFAPGQPGSITFEANIPGTFEVESHHRGDLVMELQVG
ncbi:MAG: hypothetical protein OXG34_02030 [bacterium]|nr:hypothetical protein [bacterium]